MGTVSSRLLGANDSSPPLPTSPIGDQAHVPPLFKSQQQRERDEFDDTMHHAVPVRLLVLGASSCGKTSLFLDETAVTANPGATSYMRTVSLGLGRRATLQVAERDIGDVNAVLLAEEITGVAAWDDADCNSSSSTSSSSSPSHSQSRTRSGAAAAAQPAFACGQRVLCEWREGLVFSAVIVGEIQGGGSSSGGAYWDVRFDGGDFQRGVHRDRIRPLPSAQSDAEATACEEGGQEGGADAVGVQAVVLVFNVCNEDTFTAAAQWLRALRAAQRQRGSSAPPPVLLVGTCLDAAAAGLNASGQRLGQAGTGRCVDRYLAADLARECSADFCETVGRGGAHWSGAAQRGYHWPAVAHLVATVMGGPALHPGSGATHTSALAIAAAAPASSSRCRVTLLLADCVPPPSMLGPCGPGGSPALATLESSSSARLSPSVLLQVADSLVTGPGMCHCPPRCLPSSAPESVPAEFRAAHADLTLLVDCMADARAAKAILEAASPELGVQRWLAGLPYLPRMGLDPNPNPDSNPDSAHDSQARGLPQVFVVLCSDARRSVAAGLACLNALAGSPDGGTGSAGLLCCVGRSTARLFSSAEPVCTASKMAALAAERGAAFVAVPYPAPPLREWQQPGSPQPTSLLSSAVLALAKRQLGRFGVLAAQLAAWEEYTRLAEVRAATDFWGVGTPPLLVLPPGSSSPDPSPVAQRLFAAENGPRPPLTFRPSPLTAPCGLRHLELAPLSAIAAFACAPPGTDPSPYPTPDPSLFAEYPPPAAPDAFPPLWRRHLTVLLTAPTAATGKQSLPLPLLSPLLKAAGTLLPPVDTIRLLHRLAPEAMRADLTSSYNPPLYMFAFPPNRLGLLRSACRWYDTALLATPAGAPEEQWEGDEREGPWCILVRGLCSLARWLPPLQFRLDVLPTDPAVSCGLCQAPVPDWARHCVQACIYDHPYCASCLALYCAACLEIRGAAARSEEEGAKFLMVEPGSVDGYGGSEGSESAHRGVMRDGGSRAAFLPLCCPDGRGDGCGGALSLAEVGALLSEHAACLSADGERGWVEYCRFAGEEGGAVGLASQWKECPRCGLGTACGSLGNARLECARCEQDYCFVHGAAHGGRTCEQWGCELVRMGRARLEGKTRELYQKGAKMVHWAQEEEDGENEEGDRDGPIEAAFPVEASGRPSPSFVQLNGKQRACPADACALSPQTLALASQLTLALLFAQYALLLLLSTAANALSLLVSLLALPLTLTAAYLRHVRPAPSSPDLSAASPLTPADLLYPGDVFLYALSLLLWFGAAISCAVGLGALVAAWWGGCCLLVAARHVAARGLGTEPRPWPDQERQRREAVHQALAAAGEHAGGIPLGPLVLPSMPAAAAQAAAATAYALSLCWLLLALTLFPLALAWTTASVGLGWAGPGACVHPRDVWTQLWHFPLALGAVVVSV